MQPVDADVLLAGALLRLDQPRRPLHAHDEAARHLGVERARVTGLVDAQDALDPGHDLLPVNCNVTSCDQICLL